MCFLTKSTESLRGGEVLPSMLVSMVPMVFTMLVATGSRASAVGMFIVDREDTKFYTTKMY